ncbi:unnamed protein product, partial [Laminaria digitata]
AALDKACAPPLAEDFVVDSEEWDSISASVYLTKRGDVYVVALEAGSSNSSSNRNSNSGSSNSGNKRGEGGSGPLPPPSPLDVRGGGDGGGGTLVGGTLRIIAAWATATVNNTDVPARLTLPGLSPERDYELYAYAENGAGRESASTSTAGCGRPSSPTTTPTPTPNPFSVEPATSGMSQAQVAGTRLVARTAREPDEELDVPWKDLSEAEKMVEALAALNDQSVARAARGAALDPPTAEDLARCETNPVSRNKWRSFCRWWAAGGGGEAERTAFLLRECVFAAQQPEILEEAARMGVQLLEGDWDAVAASNNDTADNGTTLTTSNPSARQRRWTAFRSWYRGGRVFDRAHESLITAAMLRRPPSPGSQGRPLTPRLAPADGPRPVAPEIEGEEEEEEKEETPTKIGNDTAATAAAAAENSAADASVAAAAAAAAASEGRNASRQVTPMEILRCRASSHTPPPPPQPKRHVVLLRKDGLPPSRPGGGESRGTTGGGWGNDDPYAAQVLDAARLDGLTGWEEDRAGQGGLGGDDGDGGDIGGDENSGVIAEGLPPMSRLGGTGAAKRLRMEARRKFLEARTVGRLLDVKREDAKAKRAAAASSGVVARRGRAEAKAKKRRRSQVERGLVLKRADELLEKSGKAEDIRQRRGSLGTLRPEDVAAIGVFDMFNMEEFEPEEADPDLFRRRRSGSIEGDIIDASDNQITVWAPRSPDELTMELQLACVHPRVCLMASSAGIGVPDPEDALSPLAHKKAR